ncbi:MAG: hypothetical protein HFH03_08920 [Dorea sp.]|nr:hypothetical protein [Dorea sp.]
MKEKFIRFMYGRYGIDPLGKFTIAAGLITIVLSNFVHWRFLPLISWLFIIAAYYRMFSKNIYKRSSENQWYLNKTCRLRTFMRRQRNLLSQRKTHHIYTCPSCRQKIRIPRGKGKIEIRCPKCSTTFIKRS